MGGDDNTALASSSESDVDTARKPIVNSAWKLPMRSGLAFPAGVTSRHFRALARLNLIYRVDGPLADYRLLTH